MENSRIYVKGEIGKVDLIDLKDKTAVVGVGYTPQGRVPGRSSTTFFVEACRNAIEHAGLDPHAVDGILLQPVPWDTTASPQAVAQQLGIHPRFAALHNVLGASAGCIAQHAAWAVLTGMADYVVCGYGENSLSATPGAYARGHGDAAAYGQFGATATYGMAARRAMHEFGTGHHVWSHIAVNQRAWANLNPRAMMHSRKMTLEDYHNTRVVVDPFHLVDCCLVSDGGRAFIVTTAERAKDLKNPPVLIMGVGQDHPSWDIVSSRTMTGPTGAARAGQFAFKMAGITPKDVDAAEIYDCFTYTLELTLIDYGFFKKGEGEAFFANGRTGPGGEFPVNTSGGLLSEVYFMGFVPFTEAVIQLMGQAGARQIKDPKIIIASGNGGTLQTHSTTILRRADL